MKTNLYFQRNIFHENDDEHIDIIKKYFRLYEIDISSIYKPTSWDKPYSLKASIAIAKRANCFEKFTNALEWAGKLRKEMVSEHFYFQTMQYILDYFYALKEDLDLEDIQMFIRPVSGDKTFAGNVFSEKSFRNEFEFLMQRNVDPHTLCMVSHTAHIKKEYRLIFIDGKYVSGSQYMVNMKLHVDSSVPSDVIEYSKTVHSKYDLPPWVVLDIGITRNGPRVIELNQIETSSFYGADLDKIYKTWSEYYEKV